MASPSPRLSGYRVLVVEDSFLTAEALREALTEHGCEVVGPASRLERGLALAADETIGGAFLDINLAGEYCFPLADLLRARGVPFVFLTGYSEATVIPAAYRDVPVVSKPFEMSRVVAVVLQRFNRSVP